MARSCLICKKKTLGVGGKSFSSKGSSRGFSVKKDLRNLSCRGIGREPEDEG